MSAVKQLPAMRTTANTPVRARLAAPVQAALPEFTRGNAAMAKLLRSAKEDEPCPECAATLHRQARSGNVPAEAPPIVHEVLRSPGRPLDDATRVEMEHRFGGADFSGVRVHTDSRAAESAEAVNAKAYTVGKNVVFNAGFYQPGSSEGGHLLAHELIHTQQQSSATGQASRIEIASANSPLEAAAVEGSRGEWTGLREGRTGILARELLQRDTLGPTKSEECGETGRPSSFEHMLVEQDYSLEVNANSAREYGIPNSSADGNKGYADILDFTTPSVFEIKKSGDSIAEARNQLMRYRLYGSQCPGLEDLQYGTTYPSPHIIPGVLPNTELVIELVEPGILVYASQRIPVQAPVPVTDSKKRENVDRQTISTRVREGLTALGLGVLVVLAIVGIVLAAPYITAALALVAAYLDTLALGAAAVAAIVLIIRKATDDLPATSADSGSVVQIDRMNNGLEDPEPRSVIA